MDCAMLDVDMSRDCDEREDFNDSFGMMRAMRPMARRSSPPPTSVPASFMELVGKQSFNGCFKIKVNAAQSAKLTAALAQFTVTDLPGALATLVAIFLLQSQYAAKKDEWAMVRSKAVRYLGKV